MKMSSDRRIARPVVGVLVVLALQNVNIRLESRTISKHELVFGNLAAAINHSISMDTTTSNTARTNVSQLSPDALLQWTPNPVLPLCPNVDNALQTCSIKLANNSKLLYECRKQPALPQCNIQCYDAAFAPHYPDGSLALVANDSDEDPTNRTVDHAEEVKLVNAEKYWPPLGWGKWAPDDSYCRALANTTQSCLFDQYRYILQSPEANQQIPILPWSSEEACDLLHRQNIVEIAMIGDSLIRHLTQGMVIVLSGDPQYAFRRQRCTGDFAFSEKGCRAVVKYFDVCPRIHDGTSNTKKIRVQYYATNPRATVHIPTFPLARRNGQGKILHIYGVGNHPATGLQSLQARSGILNAAEYHITKWKSFQPYFWNLPNTTSEGDDYWLWSPVHYKLNIGRTDETNQRALQFNKDSHNLMEEWGSHGTLNTFDLTRGLSQFLSKAVAGANHSHAYYDRKTCQPTTITWDGYHFSQIVNVWKAHLLLHRFRMVIESKGDDGVR